MLCIVSTVLSNTNIVPFISIIIITNNIQQYRALNFIMFVRRQYSVEIYGRHHKYLIGYHLNLFIIL